jgi:16S rRNA (cytosine967-C5)-methyltransferase
VISPTLPDSQAAALADNKRTRLRVKPVRAARARPSRWAPGAAALADAARALSEVAFGGRSADAAIASFDARPHIVAIRAIALGSVRWYLRLSPAVEGLLTRPQTVSNEIRALLVAAAHQLEYSRNPPHATVLAAVDAARILKSPGASGLVNAVLRRFLAQRHSLLAEVDEAVTARTAHPAWLVAALDHEWPHQSARILAANNEHPPMVLRVDLTRRTREAYVAELHAAGVGASAIRWTEAAILLEKPVGISDLPAFRKSDSGAAVLSIQDAGAQLAAALLDARPGMRVLDACAAPGGKTGHLLEHTPGLRLTAVDIDPDRLVRIRENLDRLQRTAQVVAGDVRNPASFWDGQPFERILVDAPCSSTGVIRRHPDIKLLRRPDDVAAFAAAQLQILRAAFRTLALGGRLLYSTCSVLGAENEEVAERFLAEESSARPVRMPPAAQLAPGAVERSVGVQLLPGAEAGSDGFYYACVEKTTT